MKKTRFPLNLKIFWMTFIAVFVVVALQQIGVRVPQLLHPIPSSINAFQDFIVPKLEQKTNTYKIKKRSSLIPSVYVAALYDSLAKYTTT